MPGRPLRARVAEHLRVRVLVLIPIPPFANIGKRELPRLLRIVESLEKAPTLFFLGNVEEQFQHLDAVVDEIALPVVYLVESLAPHVALSGRRQVLQFEILRVDANDEYLFVMR